MINWWSWTFWKWERKIYNFHVQQNFIWSFLNDVILSWSWSKIFPFLESLNYGSLSIFGKFWLDLKFFNVSVWNVKWDLFEHEWSISNHFPPPNPQLTLQMTFWVFRWLENVPTKFKLLPLGILLQNNIIAHMNSW